MSIKAMEEEISNQTQDLPSFASQLRKTHLPKLQPSTLIFAGSGDSYAAAVFAQELSLGQAVASDPYELLLNIRRTEGKNLVIVSVSGQTRTNIKLAMKAKGVAKRRIAITANPESPLAKECDETLQLKYRTRGLLTSGTISFTASLLDCAFLLQKLPSIRLGTTLGRANAWAKNLRTTGKGAFVFVGSGVNFALALYGAAKIHEVLGSRAETVFPEELGHSKLFSIDKRRDTIVCVSSRRDKAAEVDRMLKDDGFESSLLTAPGRGVVNRSLNTAVYLQVLVLALAKRRRMVDVAFLADRQKLGLSNRLIYDAA